MKICGRCRQKKSLDSFHKNPTKKDGLQSMCKDCRKDYHREHYLKNKEKYISDNKSKRLYYRAFVNRYKSIVGCKNCRDKRFYVLDFHHKYGKDFNISNGISSTVSISKLKDEIRKCDVLCANCHREHHHLE